MGTKQKKEDQIEPLKRKNIKVYPTETDELCEFLEEDNLNFSAFVRKMVKLELRKYRKAAKNG